MSDEILEAKDVIKRQHYDKYVAERSKIWDKMVQIANMLIILEKIVLFPFDLLQIPPDDRTFWNLTKHALFDALIISFAAIALNEQDKLTIPNFRQRIETKYVVNDVGIRRKFNQHLQSVQFDQEIEEIGERVKFIRNNYVAHLDYKHNTGIGLSQNKTVVIYGLSTEELRKMLNAVKQLFNVLSFDVYHHLTLWDYMNYETKLIDVDKLFNHVASTSYYLRIPNDEWEREKQETNLNKLSSEDRAIVEYWRERVEKDKKLR